MQQGVYQQYTQKGLKRILKELNTSENGLSEREAALRLKKDGPNELAVKKLSGWRIFFKQFQSPLIYLLILAGILTLVLQKFKDACLIIGLLFITVILDFIQTYRSEKTLEKLKAFIASQTQVKRDGQIIKLKKSLLVKGDLVLIKAGDLVPSDLRIIQANGLLTDESILTGESQLAIKSPERSRVAYPEIHQAKNILFSGTKITSGKGLAVVIATGSNTELGRIARLTGTTQKESDFQKYILDLSRFLVKVVAVTLMAVFLANLIIKQGVIDIWSLLLFIVALAISVLPEALPAVTTITITRAALRLAKKSVVIKRLAALENLGNIDVLCTDETGTITQNILKLDQVLAADQTLFLFFALAGSLVCQQKNSQDHHNFEEALWQAVPAHLQKKLSQTQALWEIPFESERRLSSVLIKNNKKKYLIVRGAPEEILRLSRYSCQSLSKKTVLTNKQRWRLSKQWRYLGQTGQRTFAVGFKCLDGRLTRYQRHQERGLIFLGLASFIDPLRPNVPATLEMAKNLGVNVKILTGDAPEVAAAVAQKVGLISSPQEVLVGRQLTNISGKKFEQLVQTGRVFARLNPEQKYQVIATLQKKHSVGLLGEGINDAPALKLADVGIVVESGADIAKEAGDIVLLHKDLRVIIEAIAEGRKTFANVTKYLKTTLIGNFGNFCSLAAISLIVPFLPMLPMQILLVNFLADLPLMAVALDAVDSRELRRPRQYHLKNLAFLAIFLGLLSSVFDFIFFGIFHNLEPADLRTLWFIESVFSELLLIISIRTALPFFKAVPPSKIMTVLLLGSAGLALFLPFSPWANVFYFTTPFWSQLGIIALILSGYFVLNEIIKIYYYRRKT